MGSVHGGPLPLAAAGGEGRTVPPRYWGGFTCADSRWGRPRFAATWEMVSKGHVLHIILCPHQRRNFPLGSPTGHVPPLGSHWGI